jgi:hypothetical protein
LGRHDEWQFSQVVDEVTNSAASMASAISEPRSAYTSWEAEAIKDGLHHLGPSESM